MERETGFEPATNSLEGCDSTPELLPPGVHTTSVERAQRTTTTLSRAKRRNPPRDERSEESRNPPCHPRWIRARALRTKSGGRQPEPSAPPATSEARSQGTLPATPDGFVPELSGRSPEGDSQNHPPHPRRAKRGAGGGGWIRTTVGLSPADLQSAAFVHSATPPDRSRTVPGATLVKEQPAWAADWSRHSDSNRGPTAYKAVALPLSYAGRREPPAGPPAPRSGARRLERPASGRQARRSVPAGSPEDDPVPSVRVYRLPPDRATDCHRPGARSSSRSASAWCAGPASASAPSGARQFPARGAVGRHHASSPRISCHFPTRAARLDESRPGRVAGCVTFRRARRVGGLPRRAARRPPWRR
jgi:hypothetical protein